MILNSALTTYLTGSVSQRAAKLRDAFATGQVTVKSGATTLYSGPIAGPTISVKRAPNKWAQGCLVVWQSSPVTAFTNSMSAGAVVVEIAGVNPAHKISWDFARNAVDGYTSANAVAGDTIQFDLAVRLTEAITPRLWFGPGDNEEWPGLNANPLSFGLPTSYDVNPNTLVTSGVFVCNGLAASRILEITAAGINGALSINSGPWVPAGTYVAVRDGDLFQMRFTTGAGINDAASQSGQKSICDVHAIKSNGFFSYGVVAWSVFYNNTRTTGAQTWQIGSSQTYQQLTPALAALLRAGDVVEFDPGDYDAFEIRRCGSATQPITIRSANSAQKARIINTTVDLNPNDPSQPVYRMCFLRGHFITLDNLEVVPLTGHHIANERAATVTVNVVASGGVANPTVRIKQGGQLQSISIPANTEIDLFVLHQIENVPAQVAKIEWVGQPGGQFPGGQVPFITTRFNGHVETYGPGLQANTAFISAAIGTYTLRVSILSAARTQAVMSQGNGNAVKNCFLHDSGTGVLQTEYGTGSLTVDNNTMVDCGNWVAADPYAHCVYISGDPVSYPDHKTIIKHNRILNYGGSGIVTRGKDNQVFGNWIESDPRVYNDFFVAPYIFPANAWSGPAFQLGGHDEFAPNIIGEHKTAYWCNTVVCNNASLATLGGDSVSECWGNVIFAHNSILIKPRSSIPFNVQEILRYRVNINSSFAHSNVIAFEGALAGALPSAINSVTHASPYGWNTLPWAIISKNSFPGVIGFSVSYPAEPEFGSRSFANENIVTSSPFVSHSTSNPNFALATPLTAFAGTVPTMCQFTGQPTLTIGPVERGYATRPDMSGAYVVPPANSAPKTTMGAI